MDKRDRIVQRIARDLRDGDYVNLGIGMLAKSRDSSSLLLSEIALMMSGS